ncbi:MAG: hypothetical protein Q8K87_16055 [Hydrogenophaga sp.]|nr:hypothetical protein [Hydrogenophaga sp.]MDP3922233.1 hypothetical protein [Hydrogenophaga sp.]
MGLQLAQRLREAADGHRASTATASGADRRLNLAALLWSQARTRVWWGAWMGLVIFLPLPPGKMVLYTGNYTITLCDLYAK